MAQGPLCALNVALARTLLALEHLPAYYAALACTLLVMVAHCAHPVLQATMPIAQASACAPCACLAHMLQVLQQPVHHAVWACMLQALEIALVWPVRLEPIAQCRGGAAAYSAAWVATPPLLPVPVSTAQLEVTVAAKAAPSALFVLLAHTPLQQRPQPAAAACYVVWATILQAWVAALVSAALRASTLLLRVPSPASCAGRAHTLLPWLLLQLAPASAAWWVGTVW